MWVRATDPYPWPYDGVLDGRRLALVIAGAQRRWAGDGDPVLHRLAALAAALHRSGGIVVCLRHTSPGASSGRGMPLAVGWADEWVEAAGLDGFFGSRLDPELRAGGVDRLLLGGFGLEGPVHSTLRGANDRGYECLTLSDACLAVDPECREGALRSITMSGGIFGAVGTTVAVCEALEESR